MKKILTAILTASIIALSSPAWSNDDALTSNNGGVSSLRGLYEISDVNKAEDLKRVQREQQLIDRNYVQQPPMIPHSIRGYQVNLNANKCLACHSFKNAGEMGATKISVTHFETRSGTTLSDVSPRRYFCLQCHVTQADAKPLVENTFTPVHSLR
ncbi:nitrate reductase cytochrome c-type subunit [Psychromonas sp. RZ22]|uniref:nitrate reductase cytochrome c-type subunit n=1 Tax=Psychromonas algarum TaxID=2555643 RepID=UPI001068583E|nr:nitrate reductase cytochrome c-type subunit [Psychromonas sp. RZ22]TEW56072.1 nitrate reductase cytochrome c-type subunit [Psychromonas sp. RZ22]